MYSIQKVALILIKVLVLVCVCSIVFGCAALNRTCCEVATLKAIDFHRAEGDPIRVAHGYVYTRPHMWCEYYQDGRWLIHDDAQQVWGFSQEECPFYQVNYYSQFTVNQEVRS